ncbi:MAG: hypothetical protein KDK54_12260 [Leptospiraceae bacterium]|nr:hypothetical protein [Leptospiraceae bacterium]
MHYTIRSLLIFFLSFIPLVQVHADSDEKPIELGFYLGATNPFPGSDTARVLNSSLGIGMFGRVQWPFTLYTEVGGGFSSYLSGTERRLTTVPVYGALGYKLPYELPVSIFLKAGGGAAYVVARPANTARWDPLAVLGTEFSFVAGKKVRIGLRMDYHRIFETIGTDIPTEAKRFYLSPYDRDYRLPNPNNYKLRDGEFFYFSLMLTFLL